MAKQIWKPGNMLYPLPVVMVTVRDPEDHRDNIITVAWAGTINTNPPMLSISVRPERYSYRALEETGEFVVNLVTKDLVRSCDYCGVTSGRDIDKFKKCHLTKLDASKVQCGMIAESPVNIECRVSRSIELGSHTMFLADVLAVHADEKYLDDSGKFCLEKSSPVVYSHGAYFSLGKQCGTFGYSIKKR